MSSIYDLPTEILLRIFAYFETYELADVDQVCHQWRDVIQQFVWSRLMRVDGKVIDFPFGNAVKNFVRISYRVERVTQIFDDIASLHSRVSRKRKAKAALRTSLMILLKKADTDAVFPLNLVDYYLAKKYPNKAGESTSRQPISEARAVIAEISRELRIDQFKAIKIKKIILGKPEPVRDPLSVSYRSMRLPLLLDQNRITQLHISCLCVSTECDNDSGLVAAQSLQNRILYFPQLEFVQLDRVQFSMPKVYGSDDPEPSITIILTFRPKCGLFTTDAFLSLLALFGDTKQYNRRETFPNLISEWMESDRIEKAGVSIHSSQFYYLIGLLDYLPPRFDFSDITVLILPLVFPSLTTRLYLDVDLDDECVEELLITLRQHRIFDQLKEFCIVFVEESFSFDLSDASDDSSFIECDFYEQARKTLKILRFLSNNMYNLTRLDARFKMGGDFSPHSMTSRIDVKMPLPHLVELVHDGIVSFPFVTSVAKQAPNLRCLSMHCYHPEDERAGVERIKCLLDVLEGNRHLSSVTITVARGELPRRCGEHNIRLRGFIERANEDEDALLESIKSQITRLMSVLPKLYKISVTIKTCNFRFRIHR